MSPLALTRCKFSALPLACANYSFAVNLSRVPLWAPFYCSLVRVQLDLLLSHYSISFVL